jgi:2'-5' RNA ligase
VRLFVALHLEEPTRTRVAAIQAELRRQDRRDQVRWADVSGIHLTLQFLGEVEDARVAELETALGGAVAGLPAPRLATDRPGAFPNWRRPRVLWVGIREDGSALAGLHAAVGAACGRLGWPPEARAFQPHLTVGRVREPGAPVERALVDAAMKIEAGSQPALVHARLALVRSHLSPRGARYEDVTVWKQSSSAQGW